MILYFLLLLFDLKFSFENNMHFIKAYQLSFGIYAFQTVFAEKTHFESFSLSTAKIGVLNVILLPCKPYLIESVFINQRKQGASMLSTREALDEGSMLYV